MQTMLLASADCVSAAAQPVSANYAGRRAHLTPHSNEALRAIYEVTRQKGNGNRATLEVARRLVRCWP